MPYDNEKAEQAVKFISLLKHTKGKWSGQPFYLQDWQEKIVRDIFGTLRKDGKRQYRTVYVEIPRKNGKALDIDTPIPTPDGWRRMEDLKEGDKVFDENGEQCNVTFASSIEQNKDCYKVIFSCGESIIADADHQWHVYDRYRERFVVKTIKEMLKDYIIGNRATHKERKYSVPVAGSLKYSEKDLPIRPYTFGAWIGDGDSSGARITCAYKDLDIIKNIEMDGYDCEEKKVKNRTPAYSIGTRRGKDTFLCIRGHEKEKYWSSKVKRCLECERMTSRARRVGEDLPPITNGSFKQILNSMGVVGNKHIPVEYLKASTEQRMALLQGLMDTDGYVSKAGQCEFTTTSKTIMEQVKELINSLGFKVTIKKVDAKLNGKSCGDKYRIQFWAYQDNPVFRLKRKIERLKPKPTQKTRARNRQIVDIKKIESIPVKCIQVDSLSSLYLVGRNMIPTHNTALAAALALYMLFIESQKDPEAEIYSAAADRDQASLVFNQAASMIRDNNTLQKKCHIVDSTKRIVYYNTNSFYRAIPADAASAHGYNASCVIVDELHTQQKRDLVDTLITSQGAREEPLTIFLTTAGYDRNSICYEYHDYAKQVLEGTIEDETFYPVIYSADEEKDEWQKIETWRKANPNLGVTINEDFLKQEANKASKVPAYQNTFKRLYLNIWTQQHDRWIDLDLWDEQRGLIAEDKLKGRTCYGGLDLASVSDIAAWVMVFPGEKDNEHMEVLCRFWCPEQRLHDDNNRYRDQYQKWYKEGFLKTTPGNSLDYAAIKQQILNDAKKFKLKDMNIDRLFQAHQLAGELEDEGITILGMGQGFMSMAKPMKDLERLLLARKIEHGGNPVLRWMADNVAVKQDPAGNLKPDKSESQGKIDGIVALVMALDRAIRHQKKSVYRDRGVRSV